MANAYIIGQRRQAIGFIGVGVRLVDAPDPPSALDALRGLANDPDAPLILIFESLLEGTLEEIELIKEQSPNTVLVIPDHLGGQGLVYQIIRDEIERSIGVDLLGKQQKADEAAN